MEYLDSISNINVLCQLGALSPNQCTQPKPVQSVNLVH